MEAIISNSTWKLFGLKLAKTLIAVINNEFAVLFLIIFRTLSFPTAQAPASVASQSK